MSRNQELKKKQEENAVWPLVRHFGLTDEDVVIDDRPDVVFKNFEGKTIGIENVGYHSGKDISMTNNRLIEICQAYKRLLEERGETGFQMNVLFRNEVYSIKRLDEKAVFAELDSLRYLNKKSPRKHVLDISYLWWPPEGMVVVAPIWCGICEENLDHDLVREFIKKKERKLDVYKQMKKNEGIDEYWLNIHIPSSEFLIYGPKDEISIESNYDRVYLTFWDPVDIPLRLK